MKCAAPIRERVWASSLVATIILGRVVQSHDGEVPQILESLHDLSNGDDIAGAQLVVQRSPSFLRKFLAVVSHPLLMSIWNKATKWTRSSSRAAKAYIGKKLSVCLYPVVLEPVYLRLVPFDASAHVQDGFKESIKEFLRRSGLDAQWVEGGESLTILLHQPEQRLNPGPVLQAVCSLEASGGSPVFVIFMLPHNPALRTLPSGARDMTDHTSFRKLEQSVRGCSDWYFWHMCATQQQEDRLQGTVQALNMPACSAVLREVRILAEPPTRVRPVGRRPPADVTTGEGVGLMSSQARTTATHAATNAASSLRFHVP